MRRVTFALVVALAFTACGPQAPPLQLSELPLHERDQIFTIDYRIDRRPDRVTAVGLVESRNTVYFRFAAVNLFGVAANGRVVSRGTTIVYGSFGGPQQFSVSVTPTGEEARFQIQIGDYAIGDTFR
jgi:hypothetical protein